jgi:hypothetical protein
MIAIIDVFNPAIYGPREDRDNPAGGTRVQCDVGSLLASYSKRPCSCQCPARWGSFVLSGSTMNQMNAQGDTVAATIAMTSFIVSSTIEAQSWA